MNGKTCWSVSVSVDGVTKVSTGDENLSAALGRALSDAIYYQTIYPAGRVELCEISEQCARCWNDGTVLLRRPRSAKRIKCPDCKGRGAHGSLAPIPFTMPDSANRIRLVQDVGTPAVA